MFAHFPVDSFNSIILKYNNKKKQQISAIIFA